MLENLFKFNIISFNVLNILSIYSFVFSEMCQSSAEIQVSLSVSDVDNTKKSCNQLSRLKYYLFAL